MKNILLYFLISLFTEGVFGESVSVMEGDSVTLHTGLTEIQKDDVIDWRFGAEMYLIARIRQARNPSVYEDALDGKFRGRLKLNGQTGDLTITNFKTTDAGDYELSNSINTFKKSFSVTVVAAGDVKSVSVKEGDSVTLFPKLTEIKKDDVIDWRFGDILIARVRNNNNPSVYEDALDGKFRGRLQLNGQTGDLTITNFKTTDTGDYELSNSINTFKKKSFSVTVVAADDVKSVSVKEGDSVTLFPQLTEIKKDDVIDWRFGDILIARVRNNNNPSVYDDALDGKFRGRLQLNGQTGDLTIANFKTSDTGDYEVSNSINTFKKKSFSVKCYVAYLI